MLKIFFIRLTLAFFFLDVQVSKLNLFDLSAILTLIYCHTIAIVCRLSLITLHAEIYGFQSSDNLLVTMIRYWGKTQNALNAFLPYFICSSNELLKVSWERFLRRLPVSLHLCLWWFFVLLSLGLSLSSLWGESGFHGNGTLCLCHDVLLHHKLLMALICMPACVGAGVCVSPGSVKYSLGHHRCFFFFFKQSSYSWVYYLFKTSGTACCKMVSETFKNVKMVAPKAYEEGNWCYKHWIKTGIKNI